MPKFIPKVVTLSRPVWRQLVVQATGHVREGGGLLIGKRTRYGNFRVYHEVSLTHEEASESHIRYNYDEVARARMAAYAAYGPSMETIGMWHTHPHEAVCPDALIPQLSTEGTDNDMDEMQVGETEVICIVFPNPDFVLDMGKREFLIQQVLGGIRCRAEAWLKTTQDDAKPCLIRVRSMKDE